MKTYFISTCVRPRQNLPKPELYMYLMCSESIVRYYAKQFRSGSSELCLSEQGTSQTLSIHRSLKLIVVELHSSNSSMNVSSMYPDFLHARTRRRTSKFPGSFPFTLQRKKKRRHPQRNIEFEKVTALTRVREQRPVCCIPWRSRNSCMLIGGTFQTKRRRGA